MLSVELFRGIGKVFTSHAERVREAWQRYLAFLQVNHQRRMDEIGRSVLQLYTASDETSLSDLALGVLRLTQEHPVRDFLIGNGLEYQVNSMGRQGSSRLLIWVIDELSNQIGHPPATKLILTGPLRAADVFWQTRLEQPGIPIGEVLLGTQRRCQIRVALRHINPSLLPRDNQRSLSL